MKPLRGVRFAKALSTIAATLVFAGAAQGAAPLRDVVSLDFTYPSTYWTNLCGVPVIYTVTGTIRVISQPGSRVAHEIDTLGDFKQVLSSPNTGGSFTQILGPTKIDYPDGISIGATARVSFLGVGSSAPGVTETGRYVYDGDIAYILSGLPAVELFGPISGAGRDPLTRDRDAYDAAACAALQG